jgi:hypothetical protein
VLWLINSELWLTSSYLIGPAVHIHRRPSRWLWSTHLKKIIRSKLHMYDLGHYSLFLGVTGIDSCWWNPASNCDIECRFVGRVHEKPWRLHYCRYTDQFIAHGNCRFVCFPVIYNDACFAKIFLSRLPTCGWTFSSRLPSVRLAVLLLLYKLID